MDIPFHSKSSVLFENDAFIVLDKPAGVLSHPNPKKDPNPAPSILSTDYDHAGEFYRLKSGFKLYLLHRIDKETSGCLLFCKDSALAKKVKSDFENHKVHKEYTALVGGILKTPTSWKDHLVKKNGKMVIERRAKPNAITDVKPIEVFQNEKISLLSLLPKSGRMHQLRIQSSKRSLPILGDRQYGDFVKNKNVKTAWELRRMFLHAAVLEFIDPKSGKKIRIESALPAELSQVIESLRSA